jgi:hypothetical protein
MLDQFLLASVLFGQDSIETPILARRDHVTLNAASAKVDSVVTDGHGGFECVFR